jgi:hypothetical protein
MGKQVEYDTERCERESTGLLQEGGSGTMRLPTDIGIARAHLAGHRDQQPLPLQST